MPTTVTRFEIGQPVVYDGNEYVISGIDIKILEHHVVERYFLDDNRLNIDVGHLTPVEAPEPEPGTTIIINDQGRLFYRDASGLSHEFIPDPIVVAQYEGAMKPPSPLPPPSKKVVELMDRFKARLAGRKIPRSGVMPREWMDEEMMSISKALCNAAETGGKADYDYVDREYLALKEERR